VKIIQSIKLKLDEYIEKNGCEPTAILITLPRWYEILMAGSEAAPHIDILARKRAIFGIPLIVGNCPDDVLDCRHP